MVASVAADTITVIHDVPRSSFRAFSAEGIELGHVEYRLVHGRERKAIDFFHTFTRPEAQGRGVAGKMVGTGLEWAIEQRLEIIPSCSYVAAYMKKNPKYQSSL